MDYGLARRATFAAVLAGRTTVTDVCDAHPYLLPADLVREAGLAVLPGQVLVREGQATYEQGRHNRRDS